AAIELGDQHLPQLDLLDRKVNGIRMRYEMWAIRRIRERCPPLQRFERIAFVRASQPDVHALSAL
ncbi:MAG TPA: hypothetical protein VGP93_08380, partial [Polyangiaceae bacterium]|nr:hypothetical protein [Polyangiaceae bacterium]